MKKYLNSKAKKLELSGVGIIEVLLMILVVGIIAVIIINGTATTVVVMDRVEEKESLSILAEQYLGKISREAESKDYYETLRGLNYPPFPLTGEYTLSGRYNVQVDISDEENDQLIVTMIFKNPRKTSFEEADKVYSRTIYDPAPSEYAF